MLTLHTTRPSDFAAQEPHLLNPVFLQRPDFFPTTHISLSRPGNAGAQDSTGQQGSVRLHGANHMLEISNKVQFFTSSPVLFNGNLETLAPKSVSQEFNERPHSSFDQEVLLVNADDTPAVGVAFELLRDDGNMAGKSAEDGSTQLQKSTGMDSYVIRYKGELP